MSSKLRFKVVGEAFAKRPLDVPIPTEGHLIFLESMFSTNRRCTNTYQRRPMTECAMSWTTVPLWTVLWPTRSQLV